MHRSGAGNAFDVCVGQVLVSYRHNSEGPAHVMRELQLRGVEPARVVAVAEGPPQSFLELGKAGDRVLLIRSGSHIFALVFCTEG